MRSAPDRPVVEDGTTDGTTGGTGIRAASTYRRHPKTKENRPDVATCDTKTCQIGQNSFKFVQASGGGSQEQGANASDGQLALVGRDVDGFAAAQMDGGGAIEGECARSTKRDGRAVQRPLNV